MAFDYIVVGGGTAGVILASRLSEDPKRSILMIEAGRDYFDLESMPKEISSGNDPWNSQFQGAHSWGYKGVATPYRDQFHLPSGKVVGGSSAINGQVFLRGIPADYNAWAESGNDLWSFEKVLPYFIRMEKDLDFGDKKFHGNNGPIPIRRIPKEDCPANSSIFWEACLAEGLPETMDANDPDSTGVGPRPLNNYGGLRMGTALTYLPEARNRSNLTIVDRTEVKKIILNHNRAMGVEIVHSGITERIYGGEIIVTSGVFNSPKLLMLSGLGDANYLTSLGIKVKQDLPGVGQNLQDHPSAYLLYTARISSVDKDMPPSQVGLRFQVSGSPYKNDMQITPTLRGDQYSNTKKDHVVHVGFTVGLQKTVSCGQVKLSDGNSENPPLINFRYLSQAFDLQRMREGIRFAEKLSKHKEFNSILIGRVQPTDKQLGNDKNLNKWLLANVSTQLHSCGTCKMGGDSDRMAVVDQCCRVHGIKNLRVVDASIMPSIIRANTMATVVMIAEKIAASILSETR